MKIQVTVDFYKVEGYDKPYPQITVDGYYRSPMSEHGWEHLHAVRLELEVPDEGRTPFDAVPSQGEVI